MFRSALRNLIFPIHDNKQIVNGLGNEDEEKCGIKYEIKKNKNKKNLRKTRVSVPMRDTYLIFSVITIYKYITIMVLICKCYWVIICYLYAAYEDLFFSSR